MPFKLGWKRSKASGVAGSQSQAERGYSKRQGSLVGGPKDDQEDRAAASGSGSQPVIWPATAHAASPAVAMTSKPSLLRRTLSTLSMRYSPKVNREGAPATGGADTPANGSRSVESAPGRKLPELNVLMESESGKKAPPGHSFLPRFHMSHHQQASHGHDGSTEHGLQPGIMSFHFPHFHLPHILDNKQHQAVAQPDILHGVENRIEVMKILEDATARSKKIIQNARGVRENLMQRAREEAEEEMNALRQDTLAFSVIHALTWELSLEQEGLAKQGGEADAAESLRLATLEEETRTHELLETSEANMAAAVNLCVEHVLDVNVSLSPDRRGVLRNMKNNPPSFLRKSQGSRFPSVRNSAAARRSAHTQGFRFSDQTWDVDPREFRSAETATDSQARVYAQILGGRTYSDDDEIHIDFDELERPLHLRRLSTAMQTLQNSCGCFFG
ncbi:hypothetical protein Efla_002000 [Eimeria flavescens]